MKWRAAVVLVAVLSVCAVLYTRIGWSRMESECESDRPGEAERGSVAYSWSWQPTGFTCTYADGTSETSPWF